jgi:hypothetical protein
VVHFTKVSFLSDLCFQLGIMIELGAVAFGLVWENWSKGVKKFLVPSLSRFTGTILTVWFIMSYFLAV